MYFFNIMCSCIASPFGNKHTARTIVDAILCQNYIYKFQYFYQKQNVLYTKFITTFLQLEEFLHVSTQQ